MAVEQKPPINRNALITGNRRMFSQIAIVLMGLFLVVSGIRSGDYINIGLGALIVILSASTLYRLKTGK